MRESFDDDGRDDEIRKTLHDTRRVGNERDIWLSRSCFRRVIGGPVDVFNRYDVRWENRRNELTRLGQAAIFEVIFQLFSFLSITTTGMVARHHVKFNKGSDVAEYKIRRSVSISLFSPSHLG